MELIQSDYMSCQHFRLPKELEIKLKSVVNIESSMNSL